MVFAEAAGAPCHKVNSREQLVHTKKYRRKERKKNKYIIRDNGKI